MSNSDDTLEFSTEFLPTGYGNDKSPFVASAGVSGRFMKSEGGVDGFELRAEEEVDAFFVKDENIERKIGFFL